MGSFRKRIYDVIKARAIPMAQKARRFGEMGLDFVLRRATATAIKRQMTAVAMTVSYTHLNMAKGPALLWGNIGKGLLVT